MFELSKKTVLPDNLFFHFNNAALISVLQYIKTYARVN